MLMAYIFPSTMLIEIYTVSPCMHGWDQCHYQKLSEFNTNNISFNIKGEGELEILKVTYERSGGDRGLLSEIDKKQNTLTSCKDGSTSNSLRGLNVNSVTLPQIMMYTRVSLIYVEYQLSWISVKTIHEIQFSL